MLSVIYGPVSRGGRMKVKGGPALDTNDAAFSEPPPFPSFPHSEHDSASNIVHFPPFGSGREKEDEGWAKETRIGFMGVVINWKLVKEKNCLLLLLVTQMFTLSLSSSPWFQKSFFTLFESSLNLLSFKQIVYFSLELKSLSLSFCSSAFCKRVTVQYFDH